MKITNFIIIGVLVAITTQPCQVLADITGTAHDLTAGSGGNPCSYCHTPHGTTIPVWSHTLSTAVYTIYESSSLDAVVGQPTGSSKLCLSCHDGTVALTDTVFAPGGGDTYISSEVGNLSTDLSNDHPISFVYSAALAAGDIQIKPPSSLPGEFRLSTSDELQCSTCHDPHDNKHGKFLVASNQGSALCIVCHDLSGWPDSIHRSLTTSVIGTDDEYLQNSTYDSMADIGCQNCHRPHSAGGPERLLHFENSEENCLNCHNGSVASTDLDADISRISSHDVVQYSGIHDIKEVPSESAMHVECVDCHNPHAIQETIEGSLLPDVMQKVSGVTMAGAFTQEAQFEYEVCFKCHADNPDKVTSTISRQITQFNTRLEFDSSNPSYHPVASPGANQNVPSLIPPMTVDTVIKCTDCHSSNSSAGIKGPHGSDFTPLLAYNYQTLDYTQESIFAYELCYQCHSRNSILGNESFKWHKKHVENGEIPCSACHDAHGVSSAQGSTTNNSHLINFDLSIVFPDPDTGRLEFIDEGTYAGECFLECHNRKHSSKDY